MTDNPYFRAAFSLETHLIKLHSTLASILKGDILKSNPSFDLSAVILFIRQLMQLILVLLTEQAEYSLQGLLRRTYIGKVHQTISGCHSCKGYQESSAEDILCG